MLLAKNIFDANFVERPNRFLGIVELKSEKIQCFIPNPGRMKELLTENKKVWLNSISKNNRKTSYDLIAVEHEDKIVSIDSRVPNKFVFNLLQKKYLFNFEFDEIKPEFSYKNSRLDFFLRKNNEKYLVEVKSCTLVKDKTALFPDAPTERGARHVSELIGALKDGYKSFIIFIIQRDDAEFFSPNEETDKNFSEKLKLAQKEGVIIKALTNRVFIRENNLYIEPSNEIKLKIN
ncbi:MAG: DNA/RNA nuclease SfsA [Candidatus Helarchaeota archaeon]|nr:DNA/RNA nuclease SfsA [Candidatus Helarchaeota archaeon]